MRFGLQHQVLWSGTPAGLPLNITTMAEHLTAAGYATHAIGCAPLRCCLITIIATTHLYRSALTAVVAIGARKWHMGFYAWDFTPTFRGFQSYLGYYGGGEGYFSHSAGAGSESPGPYGGERLHGYDFRLEEGRRCGAGCSQVLWSLNGSSCSAFGSCPARGGGGCSPQGCVDKYSTIVFSERAVEVIE